GGGGGGVGSVVFLLHSPSLSRLDAGVRRSDTLQISNHLPLAAGFLLPH
ncbi:hypothetical protein ACPTKQ_29980, partial [Pseudomonas aeruginosa]